LVVLKRKPLNAAQLQSKQEIGAGKGVTEGKDRRVTGDQKKKISEKKKRRKTNNKRDGGRCVPLTQLTMERNRQPRDGTRRAGRKVISRGWKTKKKVIKRKKKSAFIVSVGFP